METTNRFVDENIDSVDDGDYDEITNIDFEETNNEIDNQIKVFNEYLKEIYKYRNSDKSDVGSYNDEIKKEMLNHIFLKNNHIIIGTYYNEYTSALFDPSRTTSNIDGNKRIAKGEEYKYDEDEEEDEEEEDMLNISAQSQSQGGFGRHKTYRKKPRSRKHKYPA